MSGFTHNERIDLSDAAALLAQRQHCYCDIYYPEGLDIECQGGPYHDNEASFLSDADRSTGLELMGITVLPVTSKVISSPLRTDALARTIAQNRGLPFAPKTDAQWEAARQLREELLADWESLPDV